MYTFGRVLLHRLHIQIFIQIINPSKICRIRILCKSVRITKIPIILYITILVGEKTVLLKQHATLSWSLHGWIWSFCLFVLHHIHQYSTYSSIFLYCIIFINFLFDTVWIIGWTICHLAGSVPNFSFLRWQPKKSHTITSLLSVPPIQEYLPTIVWSKYYFLCWFLLPKNIFVKKIWSKYNFLTSVLPTRKYLCAENCITISVFHVGIFAGKKFDNKYYFHFVTGRWTYQVVQEKLL